MKSVRLLIALLVALSAPSMASAGPAPDMEADTSTHIFETIQPGKFRLNEGALICGPVEFVGLDRNKQIVAPPGTCIGDKNAAK